MFSSKHQLVALGFWVSLGCASADERPDSNAQEAEEAVFVGQPPFKVVDVGPGTPPATQLAVQACVGLYNRETGGSIYTIQHSKDAQWLAALGLQPGEVTDVPSFLDACLSKFPRCVRYSYYGQQELLPNILTVGAVLEAVPLDEVFDARCNIVFDARAVFEKQNTPYLATKYVYDNYVNETTGLAMLNPGYDTGDSVVWNPSVTSDMDPSLVDFVFSRKLFVMFLINGCVSLTRQNRLMNDIARENPWPKPVGVYGYANYWKVFGGYVFEAQTRCSSLRNMGAIPTAYASNLSFFSTRREPIVDAGELVQSPLEDISYEPDNTYVAFIVGDGDNVAYILDQRAEWMRQRLSACGKEKGACPPLTWSISPHLSQFAPDVLQWYFDMSRTTGSDYFMLPPSGHLYAYPASMGEEMQEEFVAATESDARLLGTQSTISWDWWNTWSRAESSFLPKYATQNGTIAGVFPVNVPYMFPTFTWGRKQFFKVLVGHDGGKVVLFRPREWRGIDGSGNFVTKKYFLKPEDMARELGAYPRGTVSHVYMTSDGGLNLQNSFMPLVEMLPDHVRLVSADRATELALEARSLQVGP